MLSKIKSNPMNSVSDALPLYVPVCVTRGALIAHWHSFASPRCIGTRLRHLAVLALVCVTSLYWHSFASPRCIGTRLRYLAVLALVCVISLYWHSFASARCIGTSLRHLAVLALVCVTSLYWHLFASPRCRGFPYRWTFVSLSVSLWNDHIEWPSIWRCAPGGI